MNWRYTKMRVLYAIVVFGSLVMAAGAGSKWN